MMNVDGAIKVLSHPQQLLVGAIHYITGWFYPYIPIYTGLLLILIVRWYKQFPSFVLWLSLFAPVFMLSLWSSWVFIFNAINQLQMAIGVIGIILILVALWIGYNVSELDVKEMHL